MINLAKLLANLPTVPRWGIVRTIWPQSVAEHTYGVLWILQWLETERPSLFEDLTDAEKLEMYRYALRHDAGEAISGDIPSVAKFLVRDGTAIHLEVQHGVAIDPEINRPEALNAVKHAVKTADYLEALLFLNREVISGNRSCEGVAGAVMAKFEDHMGHGSGFKLFEQLMQHINYMEPPGLDI